MSNFAELHENAQCELLKSKTASLVYDVLRLSVSGNWGITVIKYFCYILMLLLELPVLVVVHVVRDMLLG